MKTGPAGFLYILGSNESKYTVFFICLYDIKRMISLHSEFPFVLYCYNTTVYSCTAFIIDVYTLVHSSYRPYVAWAVLQQAK